MMPQGRQISSFLVGHHHIMQVSTCRHRIVVIYQEKRFEKCYLTHSKDGRNLIFSLLILTLAMDLKRVSSGSENTSFVHKAPAAELVIFCV